MDTGAPATERGQQRRISLMILLMVILVGAVLAYGMLDPGRADDAAETQREEAANHGANLFARNCAGCHGTRGQGLIGPALNLASNRPDDTATADQLKDLYHNTITCGRVGTAMPAWGQTQKGPLNDFQIGQLVALITTQGPGGADDEAYWDHAEELWHELNPGLEEPVISGAPSINEQACGQYAPGAKPTSSATATATAAPTAPPAPPATTFDVVATDNAFDNTALSVPVGQEITITLKNDGAAIHNLHIPDLTVTSQPLPGGQAETITFTVASAGTYNFLCDFHPVEMVGTVTAQ